MVELPGILAWAVRGRRGVGTGAAWTPRRPCGVATREYRTAEDVLSAFVDDPLHGGEATCRATLAQLLGGLSGVGGRGPESGVLSMRELSAKIEERFTKAKGNVRRVLRGIPG